MVARHRDRRDVLALFLNPVNMADFYKLVQIWLSLRPSGQECTSIMTVLSLKKCQAFQPLPPRKFLLIRLKMGATLPRPQCLRTLLLFQSYLGRCCPGIGCLFEVCTTKAQIRISTPISIDTSEPWQNADSSVLSHVGRTIIWISLAHFRGQLPFILPLFKSVSRRCRALGAKARACCRHTNLSLAGLF